MMFLNIHPKKIVGAVVAVVIALGLLGVAAPTAQADDFNCTGTVGAVTKDNVDVPDNATCTLDGTTVEGNIKVGTNATMIAKGVKVDGNIQAQGAKNLVVNNGSTVGGSIQIEQGGSGNVTNVDVDSDIQFFSNSGAVEAKNNTVGGNLQADENTGGVSIIDNIIDGNLQCKQNNPPPTGSGNKAASLEDQCSTLGGDGGNDDDDEIERHGRIDSFPPKPYIGTWVIDGVNYTADSSTEFEQDYGAFVNGVCVEVEAKQSTLIATEIETEEDYQCSGRTDDDDDDADGELYGVVTKLPAGHIGDWVIGGKNFKATSDTEFESEGGRFAVGVTVQVEYSTSRDGVSIAKEIELKYDDDDDDDDYGKSEGAEGQSYGILESRPAGRTGNWTISGIVYGADSDTELDDDDDLKINDRVKVKYTVQADGKRIAHEIDETDDDGDVSDKDNFKLVGFVQQMPSAGYIGTWKVAGVDFVADLNTEYEEDDGTFAIGAYVEVEYFRASGVNRIKEIETEVPPGAGDDDSVGRIRSMSGSMQAASLDSSQWQIGNTLYMVTPATQLITDAGDLVVDANVIVNSYVAAGGSRTATRIKVIGELQTSIYLPLQRK